MDKKKKQANPIVLGADLLFHELATLIDKSKKQLVSAVNNTLCLLFWQVGEKINHI